MAQRLKCLPAMRETWVRPLGWEDPPEKEMATHSNILGWRIPWTCIVHGILQARILEWVVISFSGGSSQPRVQTLVSCLASRFFTI